MPATPRTTAPRARTASTARRAPASRPEFKEPAALKQLGRSLETADAALTELGRHAGRDVSQGAHELYNDLQKFVSQARRDSRKLSSALRRDFEVASRELERSQRQLTGRSSAAKRRGTAPGKARTR